MDVHLRVVCDAAVNKGFVEALVRILQLYVLAHNRNVELFSLDF